MKNGLIYINYNALLYRTALCVSVDDIFEMYPLDTANVEKLFSAMDKEGIDSQDIEWCIVEDIDIVTDWNYKRAFEDANRKLSPQKNIDCTEICGLIRTKFERNVTFDEKDGNEKKIVKILFPQKSDKNVEECDDGKVSKKLENIIENNEFQGAETELAKIIIEKYEGKKKNGRI